MRFAIVLAVSRVSVLFSEPKIPQLQRTALPYEMNWHVSVLFSEPKIPQHCPSAGSAIRRAGFSALQRAENSSTVYLPPM